MPANLEFANHSYRKLTDLVLIVIYSKQVHHRVGSSKENTSFYAGVTTNIAHGLYSRTEVIVVENLNSNVCLNYWREVVMAYLG